MQQDLDPRLLEEIGDLVVRDKSRGSLTLRRWWKPGFFGGG
ncbi:hypothetical protein [Calothrix sp. PCC 6303]|nr:hypothetical protein [Calothrix sp. PCC 6303]